MHGLQRESTSVEYGSTENKKVLIRLSLPLVLPLLYLQMSWTDKRKRKWTKRKLLRKCAIPGYCMDKREIDRGMSHSLGQYRRL